MTTIEGMVKSEKSPFFSYHNNNQFRQESSVGAKTTDWKFIEEHDIYLLAGYLIVKKMSKGAFLVELSGRYHLKQVIKLSITEQLDNLTPCASWWKALRSIQYHWCSIPAKNALDETNHKEIIRKIKIKGHPLKMPMSWKT